MGGRWTVGTERATARAGRTTQTPLRSQSHPRHVSPPELESPKSSVSPSSPSPLSRASGPSLVRFPFLLFSSTPAQLTWVPDQIMPPSPSSRLDFPPAGPGCHLARWTGAPACLQGRDVPPAAPTPSQRDPPFGILSKETRRTTCMHPSQPTIVAVLFGAARRPTRPPRGSSQARVASPAFAPPPDEHLGRRGGERRASGPIPRVHRSEWGERARLLGGSREVMFVPEPRRAGGRQQLSSVLSISLFQPLTLRRARSQRPGGTSLLLDLA